MVATPVPSATNDLPPWPFSTFKPVARFQQTHVVKWKSLRSRKTKRCNGSGANPVGRRFLDINEPGYTSGPQHPVMIAKTPSWVFLAVSDQIPTRSHRRKSRCTECCGWVQNRDVTSCDICTQSWTSKQNTWWPWHLVVVNCQFPYGKCLFHISPCR